ncbi:MAG: hypothetical protein MJE77_14870 [Proteobacteria bacterium]|nr:hypothetical protein [Pseudomonadota bacterium]
MVSSGMGDRATLSGPLKCRFHDETMSRQELPELMTKFVDDVVAGRHSEEGWPSSAYRMSKIRYD